MGDASRLILVCDDLTRTPRYALPDSYFARWFSPGDEAAWLRIHEQADQFTVLSPGLFREKFGSDDDLLSKRQAFAVYEGLAVGTVTAWQGELNRELWGRVHWLAVLPEHQHKGIGRALMSLCCQRLVELGFRRAYLVTHPARTEAMSLYEAFGFGRYLPRHR